VQVTHEADTFGGGQGEPLWRQATDSHSNICGVSGTQECCRKGLLVALSGLHPLYNIMSDQEAGSWAVSKPVTGFDKMVKSDTTVCIKASLRASAMSPNNLTGSYPQLGLTALQAAPKAKPSGPTTTPKFPAGIQGKLPDTCKDEPGTCAVPSSRLPALLTPAMPGMPDSIYITLGRDPSAWQSWFSEVQVGGQIRRLQVADWQC
jgi:hypothetical protein